MPRSSVSWLLIYAVSLACPLGASGQIKKDAVDQAPRERMSYLDNGIIRLGADLNKGGAITWLSNSGDDENVVNSYDYGRQIQMSYYSGPVPYVVGDKRPAEHWRHIGWNPIQTGDDFGHASRVLEHRNDGSTLYVKCVPMQWPLDDVPGECTFECWITLDGAAAQVRSRLNNARTDKTQYPARRQELPAVYVNGPYHRLMAYTGDQPFTGGALTRIVKPAGEPGPWTHWNSAENWSALVRDDDWGLGVWHPGCFSFGGGFAGPPGKGGPHDVPTGYISPGHVEVIDWNIGHEYRYALILGTLEEIRQYVYRQPRRDATPDFHFQRERQHWHFINARDAGWPLQGEWRVTLDGDDPQLISPDGLWQAADAPTLYLRAAYRGRANRAQLFWQTFAEPGFSERNSLKFEIEGDGEYRTYAIPLASASGYRGAITALRLDPAPVGGEGDFIAIRSITSAAPADAK